MSKLFCLLTVVACSWMAQASYLMWQINPPFEHYCLSFVDKYCGTAEFNPQTDGLKGGLNVFFLELMNYDPGSISVSVPADVWHGSTGKNR